MIEDVTTALQAFATTGNGLTVTLSGLRFLTFKVQGNGNVTAGAVAIECCPQNTPIAPGSGQRSRHPHIPAQERLHPNVGRPDADSPSPLTLFSPEQPRNARCWKTARGDSRCGLRR
jgi:hypothetical protein